MRKAAWILALAIVMSLFATLGLPSARADLVLPLWKVGNEWSYDLAEQISGSPRTGSFHLQVVGFENVTVSTRTFATFRLAIHSNVTDGSTTQRVQGTVFFRTSDLALVKEVVQLTFVSGTVTGTASLTVADDPPLTIQWPLASDHHWNATTIRRSTVTVPGFGTTTSNTTIAANFTVETSENRTVPAGTFLTLPLNQTTGSGHTTDYWSAVVGNYVEEQYVDSVNRNTLVLTAYNYTMPQENPGGGSPTGSLDIPWLLWLGVGVVIAVVASLVLVLSRGRPRAPAAVPAPEAEPPASPPPPP